MPDYVRWLGAVSIHDRPLVGGKAAVLGHLLQAGYLVPDGFCLTVAAFEEWRSRRGFPPTLAKQIAAAYRMLVPEGTGVAVRSSGVAEDSAVASFAGQYETVLDVKAEAELTAAIVRCWAAARSARVRRYRAARWMRSEAGLPLLVQRMLPATASGVLFTVDPLSGERQAVIEAVPGLGDKLVAGQLDPARWRVAIDGSVCGEPVAAQPLLIGGQCRELAELGWQLAVLLGAPQDVEWALCDGRFYVLQARPIASSLARRVAATQAWTRANIGETLPGVVTPLSWSVFRRGLLSRPLPLSVEPGGQDVVRLISGRAYLRLDAVWRTFCQLPGATPDVVQQALGIQLPAGLALVPEPGRPVGIAGRAAQALFLCDVLARAPLLRRRVAGQESLPAVGADKPQAGDLERLLSWLARRFPVHLRCTAYTVGVLGLCSALLHRWCPAQADRLLPALLPLREESPAVAQWVTLRHLAEQSRRFPAATTLLLQDSDWPTLVRTLPLARGGADLLTDLETFLSHNGSRTEGEFELIAPRWREDPSMVLAALRGCLRAERQAGAGSQTADEQLARQDALAALEAQLPRWQMALLRRLLSAFGVCVSLRESVKYQLLEAFGALRRLFLAVGQELYGRRLLDTAADVFFLTVAETASLAWGIGLAPPDVQRTVHERRNTYTAEQQQSAPFWVLDAPIPTAPPAGGATLRGLTCSPGRVHGRARVLTNVALAGAFRPGEVLVAPSADPGYTPLFLVAAGLVTESGGFLSHGATVAREYGIPTLTNVSSACTAIQTGDWVTVDGDRGTVTIHSSMAG